MTTWICDRPAHETDCADVHARLGDPHLVLLDACSRAGHAAGHARAGVAR